MIKFLLLFLLPFSLYASKILSYNIYDRSDRVDVMITFDTPYTGTIRQSTTKTKIIIKLEDATIEAPKIKKVSSKYLQTLTITPLQNETQIIALVPSSVRLIASKTSDAYGLRLRFTTKTAIKKSNHVNRQTNSNYSLSSLPTKKESDMTKSYAIVIAILIIGILLLFYIKRKMPTPKNRTTKEQNSWLFKSNEAVAQASQSSNEVEIRFQKAIDDKNSVVMLDFGVQSYLVLMGNNNILLDKFHDNKPSSQQEFESILQDRHEELESFLRGGNTTSLNKEAKEPLQAYKERAASLLYSD
ncbi:hypothetical protein [Sulfurimonas sp.]